MICAPSAENRDSMRRHSDVAGTGGEKTASSVLRWFGSWFDDSAQVAVLQSYCAGIGGREAGARLSPCEGLFGGRSVLRPYNNLE
jgi:hypothetical protein